MSSVIHIAEVAAILAVAYSLGWVLGYFARRMTAPHVVTPAIPEARIAAVTAPASDALVKAPVIAPVAMTPIEPVAEQMGLIEQPAVAEAQPVEPAIASEPEPVPAPEPVQPEAAASVESLAAPELIPAPSIQPAPEPVPAIIEPPVVEIPAVALPPAVESPEPIPAVAESETPPAPELAPLEQVSTVDGASSPAARAIRRFRPAPKPMEPAATVPAPPPAPFFASPATKPGVAWTGEIKGKPSMPHAELVQSLVPAEPPAPEPAPTPPPAALQDEDAAMRAIEGGWSRTGARAPVDTPELSDMGAAVAAATTAVEQVLAQAGIEMPASEGMKPRGLLRPRNGTKDDLRRINGLGALDESTLNNLGIFHFDQIAAWSEAQVSWMEDHVFARGRIGREEWQRQARELSTLSAA